MKYNKLATVLCSAALGLLALTSCEGGDLFGINSPDWLSSKADSIAAEKAKNQGGDEIIEGMHDDVPESYFLNAGSIDDVLARVK